MNSGKTVLAQILAGPNGNWPRPKNHSPLNSVNPPRFAGNMDIKLTTGA
jgi:hypothetical protein